VFCSWFCDAAANNDDDDDNDDNDYGIIIAIALA